MAAQRSEILVLNHISPTGLKRLPAERYHVVRESGRPDAVLVRSADMRGAPVPPSVRAIARAGAGVNNIPVADMSARGVPVFNAPGANANAVKELVLAGLLIAARNVAPALAFVNALQNEDEKAFAHAVEEGKKDFAGCELPHHTLGVIGLGRIGSLVADAAIKLGMNVVGHDPEITVDAAWKLPSQVKRAHSVDEVLRGAHFVSVHVPLTPATQGLIGPANIHHVRQGAVLLNFSRDGIYDDEAVTAALEGGRVKAYVTDFPTPRLVGRKGVIALPHLGASTREAEENCAVMAIDQLRDFLEQGNVTNAVNFPNVAMPRETAYRLAIANRNVPNMVGQISAALGRAGVNIHNMMNKSRGEMAYTLVDVDSEVQQPVVDGIAAIDGVLSVRYVPATT
jgi:D-3-phosphoglycerate dehydrogenase